MSGPARGMRLAYMGTPDFAVPALEALVDAGHEIAAVYTQPPRPAHRGKKEMKSAVHARAEALGLEVRHPASLKSDSERAAFAALDLDAAVVAAYGLILPPPVLNAPRLGCLNIHASLLPRWRGAAPIHRAILAGDTETGVTIMQMDAGLDTGAMLLTERIPIPDTATAATLHDELAALGARMIVEALAGLGTGALTPTPQPDDGVTYAEKLTRAEGRLDWRKDAAELARQVRAFDPWPGAWFELGDERIKVLAARAVDRPGAPGELVEDLTIACGMGALRIEKLQRAGKAPVAADAFLRGFDLPPGTVLP